jgi:glyoxylase-like metal-dependent hydrolase (beta-lactamase superfamily II)/rhodanese-related sulfurtransferase
MRAGPFRGVSLVWSPEVISSDIIAWRADAKGYPVLIFRQLFDPTSSTYTYLLADSDSGEAVMIDPVFEQARRDAALIRELGLKLLWTLETHIHADHVTGAWALKQRLGSQIAEAEAGKAEGVDRPLNHGDRIAFGTRRLEVRATPGHTASCLTYVLDDRSMAFTGDCLLIRGCGRTDFQQGSSASLYGSVHEQIFSLPDSCLIYPAHDYRGLTSSSVGEERQYNPRLGGELSESDFEGFMKNLKLAHPKQIDIAVPANLKCGQPDNRTNAMKDPDWAPLTQSFAGVWDVPPEWLEENGDAVQVLDVREPDEFTGPLGHIHNATLIPLGTLASRASELSKDKPIVAVCRAGGRSAQATAILREAGFDKVANLPGGMMRWRADGRSAEKG